VIEKTKLAFWRIFVPLSVKRCERILTLSEHSKRDIVRFLGVKPDKVIVTPLALDKSLARMAQPTPEQVASVCRKYDVTTPYILDVGGVGGHKNPFVLVQALYKLRQRPGCEALSLVITGNDYGSKQEIAAQAAGLGLGQFVCLPGYVAREDLPALYRGALAYVTTSYFEGFGLTLLEAMAFGAPVVTSNRASLPEVVGDAALLIEPKDIQQIADAIYMIASDSSMRERLVARGYRRIQEFSWKRVAERTLSACYEAATGKPSLKTGECSS
jgi:glycosyltransferase involved in cell wall biosynthesis